LKLTLRPEFHARQNLHLKHSVTKSRSCFQVVSRQRKN
jgi:hypothetical protein